MNSRLELHELLCGIVNITAPDGDRHTYFDPPPSKKMKFPAIRYARESIENSHANNSVYRQDNAYTITVIDSDPDSAIVKQVAMLPKCRHSRHYKAENLNHDVFTLYY
jgi:hypothetical protein